MTQILWTMELPEWVSVIGDPNEKGGWQRLIHVKWKNGVVGALDGTNTWGYDDHPLRVMIVGDSSYAEARGLDGWYRRCKSNSWRQEVEELWEAEAGKPEMGESFPRMADGVKRENIITHHVSRFTLYTCCLCLFQNIKYL